MPAHSADITQFNQGDESYLSNQVPQANFVVHNVPDTDRSAVRDSRSGSMQDVTQLFAQKIMHGNS